MNVKARDTIRNYLFIKDSTSAFLSSFERRIRDFFPPDSLCLARANVCPIQPPLIACMEFKRPPALSTNYKPSYGQLKVEAFMSESFQYEVFVAFIAKLVSYKSMK